MIIMLKEAIKTLFPKTSGVGRGVAFEGPV